MIKRPEKSENRHPFRLESPEKDADLGLSQILCNHREVVKNRVKILKGGSGISCCRLVYKITAVNGHVKGGGVSLHSS